MLLPRICDRTSRRLARESDAAFVCDILCELPGSDLDRRTEVILPEKGNHGATGVSRASVVDDGFDAVADFDTVFSVVRCKEQQDSGTLLFCADAEMLEEIDCIVFDGTVVEGSNGDDGELRAGFMLQFGTKRLQALLRA